MKTMKEMTNLENVKPKVKRRMRWWVPIAIAALAVANVVRVRLSGDLDSMFKNMQTMLTIVVSVLLLFVWWLFLTRLRWRTRLAGLALFILGAVGLKQTVRFDGSVDGSGKPRIVWRWTAKKSGNVGEFKASETTQRDVVEAITAGKLSAVPGMQEEEAVT